MCSASREIIQVHGNQRGPSRLVACPESPSSLGMEVLVEEKKGAVVLRLQEVSPELMIGRSSCPELGGQGIDIRCRESYTRISGARDQRIENTCMF